MAEIKKRIVIASVLKPVSDTRMTEKIAASLSHDERLDVHVIGYPATYSSKEKITFHSFAPFRRMSFKRLTTTVKIFRKIRELNPSILIVTTHELLIIALLTKFLRRTKIVYDVQENYYLNILHTNAFTSLLKIPVAMYVRVKERIASHWIDHFFLAEEVYTRQLPFAKRRSTVLANKVISILKPVSQIDDPLALIFTGTLSRSTGVFEAIALAKRLYNADSSITLTIMGHAPLDSELATIRADIQDYPFIKLIGGHMHVNHQEIVQAISKAGAGIIAYAPNPATAGRIPTKLYEYIAVGLPILFAGDYPQWKQLATRASHPFQAVSFSDLNASTLISGLRRTRPRGTFAEYIYWKTEEIKLRSVLSGL